MSTRLEFTVTALRAHIEKRYTDAVKKADNALAEEIRLPERIEEWRVEQIQRVKTFARRIQKDGATAEDLQAFRIEAKPCNQPYGDPKDRHEETVSKAADRRDRALARLDAVRAYTPVGETEPVLSLTPGMATDWFGI